MKLHALRRITMAAKVWRMKFFAMWRVPRHMAFDLSALHACGVEGVKLLFDKATRLS